MRPETFHELLKRRLSQIEAVLGKKAREYASAADRLHNFKRSAAITGESPAQVCIGFFVKHLTSILDMVEANAENVVHLPEVIDEKIGDAVNYLILLEAILKENHPNLLEWK